MPWQGLGRRAGGQDTAPTHLRAWSAGSYPHTAPGFPSRFPPSRSLLGLRHSLAQGASTLRFQDPHPTLAALTLGPQAEKRD